MASLEQSLAALADVTNQNGGAFRDCLYALEARQWMIMRALERMVNEISDASTTVVEIDWRDLEKRYMDFVAEQRQAQVMAKEPQPESPEPEGAVVFGGG